MKIFNENKLFKQISAISNSLDIQIRKKSRKYFKNLNQVRRRKHSILTGLEREYKYNFDGVSHTIVSRNQF